MIDRLDWIELDGVEWEIFRHGIPVQSCLLARIVPRYLCRYRYKRVHVSEFGKMEGRIDGWRVEEADCHVSE